jgi:prepilin-type N-terminal cleavage/methylation domain-containing protein
MRRRRTHGFSLLEVLAAMSLFALVAAAIGKLAATTMLHGAMNRHYTQAAMLAQEELEDLRSLDYADIASRSSLHVVAGASYTVSTAVAPNSPASGMKHITTTVYWSGPEGTKYYAAETIYTNING